MRYRTTALLLLLATLGAGCLATPIPIPNPSLNADQGAGGPPDGGAPTKTHDGSPADSGMQPKQEVAAPRFDLAPSPVLDMTNGPDASVAGDAGVGEHRPELGPGEAGPTELGPAGDGTRSELGACDAIAAGEK